MKAEIVKRKKLPEAREASPLARELAEAFRQRVNNIKHGLQISCQEAVEKAEKPCSLDRAWSIQDCPPEKVTWSDLEELNRHSPERALQRWEEIKQAALEELRSGHSAGAVLAGKDDLAWHRAHFLAIREELSQEWQPRNGIERQLLDMMAQAQASMFFWQEFVFARHALDVYQAAEPAAMVDRFNKMFLRNLRALCNLRKMPLAVVVQNVAKMEVGPQQGRMQNKRTRRRRIVQHQQDQPGA
jgi:hypothetical protein